MLTFEGLVVAYLAFFALVAPFANVDRRTRIRVSVVATSIGAAVFMASRELPLVLRLWLAFLYIPIGYWIPVPLVPAARGGAFEAWLRRTDDGMRRSAIPLPHWVRNVVELGYFTCFPLVPVAFAVVWTAGSPADVARFWMAVLGAGYACYVSLPWLVSRPPRLTDQVDPGGAPVTRLNVRVLSLVSHRLNTFPSGHVAVAAAAAISVGRVSPTGGIALGVVAVAIAVGAVAGRYHYVVDVLLGAVVGILMASG